MWYLITMKENYEKILFCTDFSDSASFAFHFALGAAQRNPGARLILLHVIPEPDAQFWKGYIYEVGDMDAKARADIDARIAADYTSRLPEGLSLAVEMRIGDPARTILEYAEAEGVDLIVMGRQGHQPVTQWLLGNVATKISRKALCPVLIVPLEARERMGGSVQ
jgi:nucleotide-binding universal stress UspA family protein